MKNEDVVSLLLSSDQINDYSNLDIDIGRFVQYRHGLICQRKPKSENCLQRII